MKCEKLLEDIQNIIKNSIVDDIYDKADMLLENAYDEIYREHFLKQLKEIIKKDISNIELSCNTKIAVFCAGYSKIYDVSLQCRKLNIPLYDMYVSIKKKLSDTGINDIDVVKKQYERMLNTDIIKEINSIFKTAPEQIVVRNDLPLYSKLYRVKTNEKDYILTIELEYIDGAILCKNK